ncbi:MAG TPA: Wzz/FepE/Etk N-terminal domain-containing protein [Novosphingobium sp.]
MSIQQFFRIIWARRTILWITLGASLLAAAVTLLLVPKSYEATSRVVLEVLKPDPVTGEILQGGGQRAYISTQMEMVKDYRVAGRVADQLGWTGSTELAQEYESSGSEMSFQRWLAQFIIDRLDVRLIAGSNIMEIAYDGNDPDGAAKIADAVRDAFVDQTLQFKRQAAAKNAAWFAKQTEEIKAALAQAESRKAEFERKNDIILADDNSDTDTARLAALAGAAPMPAMPAMPVVDPTAGQLAQIDAAIANASRTLGPNHPDLIAMRQQRATLAAAGGTTMVGGHSGPDPIAVFNAQRSRVLSQRGKLAEAKELQNDVSVLREQLKTTSARAEQLKQESLSQDAGLTLLGVASPPDSPSFPKTWPVLFGALTLGLGVGILLSLLVELLNRRVRSVDDLMLFDVPVLGAMTGPQPERRRLPFIPALPGPQGR